MKSIEQIRTDNAPKRTKSADVATGRKIRRRTALAYAKMQLEGGEFEYDSHCCQCKLCKGSFHIDFEHVPCAFCNECLHDVASILAEAVILASKSKRKARR